MPAVRRWRLARRDSILALARTLRPSRKDSPRLTNAFSKKVENHTYAVALHMMYWATPGVVATWWRLIAKRSIKNLAFRV
jgi:hypothetical protein